MSDEPLRIVCGNPNCKAGLLIKNAAKLTDVKCPRCGHVNPLRQPVPPPPSFDSGDTTVLLGQRRSAPLTTQAAQDRVGWLVVNDEQTTTQTFTLQLGTNTVGRQSQQRPATHMIITHDEYMSRPHCTIDVRIGRSGQLEYILRDGALVSGNWKPSLNGTYLNGKEPRLSQYDQLFLDDGDTIQIGETKLVFKAGNLTTSQQQATKAVEAMDYERTIVSFKRQPSTTSNPSNS
ncbi:FHA domain-containing protein [uncultured Spirosoma sp.]|uniref:FHA domain-containing protein n=1 Tax=uncultured Spirosoma sp. TaxID=278208 RepID=UPI00258BCC33|nr:FHA domain-containing protein [uncultured Spirosoma sp.]